MKNEELYDAITDIRDDLIDGAAKKVSARSRRRLWMGAVAAVLALAILGAATLLPGGQGLDISAYAIALAEYPEMAPYPDDSQFIDKETGEFDNAGFHEVWTAWRDDQRARQNQPEGYDAGYSAFVKKSAGQLLTGAGDKNRIYSPLNIYMALAMLAELTDGNSRQQLLDTLECGDIDTLRSRAHSLWNANYIDDGAASSVLASSVWLNKEVDFIQATMDTLAENYYASSFSGDVSDPAFSAALQSWLSEQTGGLLEEQAGQIELDIETVLALATTLYFNARWDSEFNESRNTTDVFHAAGGDVTAEYMHMGCTRTYCWGDTFASVSLPFVEGGSMTFVLPDEGVSIDELLAQDELYNYLETSSGNWEKSKYLTVNMSVPKFDVDSMLDLIPALEDMGVTDVFNAAISDFSPMTSYSGLYVSQAMHAARVMIDEEGCTAAAFTVMAEDTGSAAPPDETVDFVLDRPFLFAITGSTGQTLFIGIVNQPG